MNRQIYDSIPAYNNSFLSNVKRVLQGREPFKGSRATEIGAALHQLILESDKFHHTEWDLRPNEVKLVTKMSIALLQFQALEKLLQSAQKETVKVWNDPGTGLACKGILDMITQKQDGKTCVVDIKTTSARDADEFKDSIQKYEYNRQAAFYLDAIGADWFSFLCVSKRSFKVFSIHFKKDDPQIIKGRKMYQFLLKKCIEHGIAPGADLTNFQTHKLAA